MAEIVDVITALGQVGLWLQTIGAIVILWIIFQIIAWKYNRKRMKEVYAIKDDMKRIEKKIDRLLDKK
jgi:hypothetical protein